MLIRPTLRRGLFFPPGTLPRINEEHPAAGQLVGAYLFGARPIDLRAGYGPLSVKTGSPVQAMGPTGSYTAYTITSGHVGVSSPSGDISIVAVAMRGITPGSAGTVSNIPVVATTVNIAATRVGFLFSLGNGYSGTPNRISAEQYVGGVQTFPAAAWINGAKETLSGGIGTATDLTNGVWYGVGTTYANLATGNGALTTGTMVDNFFALTGGVQFLAVFQGILSDGMMSELTLNPAGLLLWPGDRQAYDTPWPQLQADISGTVSITGSLEATLDPLPDTGDTHDGFIRRSRRQRAQDAAERRRRDEMAQEAVTLRLSLEAAMGMAAEVAEDTPAEAVEAVEAVAKRAARLVPTLADTRADEALLASAREAVAALRAAVQEAERARALAEDDEEVLMLLRAL